MRRLDPSPPHVGHDEDHNTLARATAVFVPPLAEMDETYSYLQASGFRELRAVGPNIGE